MPTDFYVSWLTKLYPGRKHPFGNIVSIFFFPSIVVPHDIMYSNLGKFSIHDPMYHHQSIPNVEKIRDSID
jgi:hypothetical protein